MPIYEYRCTNDHLVEVMQRIAEEPLRSCEVCGAPARRVLHAPAIHFKGSGFHNTDYGTARRNRESAQAGDKAGSEQPAKDGAKSDGASAAASNGGSPSKPEKAASGS